MLHTLWLDTSRGRVSPSCKLLPRLVKVVGLGLRAHTFDQDADGEEDLSLPGPHHGWLKKRKDSDGCTLHAGMAIQLMWAAKPPKLQLPMYGARHNPIGMTPRLQGCHLFCIHHLPCVSPTCGAPGA